jgi:hypothetical protein
MGGYHVCRENSIHKSFLKNYEQDAVLIATLHLKALGRSTMSRNNKASSPIMMTSEIGIRDVDPMMPKFLTDCEAYLLV